MYCKIWNEHSKAQYNSIRINGRKLNFAIIYTLIAPINQRYFSREIIKSEGYNPKKIVIYFFNLKHLENTKKRNQGCVKRSLLHANI